MSRMIPVAITSPIMQEKIGEILREKNEKLYLIYEIALQTGIPVSCLLKKQVKDVREKDNINYLIRVTNYCAPFSEDLKRDIYSYCIGKEDSDWLFPGKDSKNPLSLISVQRPIQNAAKKIGLSDVTAGSIRKTFLYNEYCRGNLTLPQFLSMTEYPSEEELKRCYKIECQHYCNPESFAKSTLSNNDKLREIFFKMDQVKSFLLSTEKINALSTEESMEVFDGLIKLENALVSMQKFIG